MSDRDPMVLMNSQDAATYRTDIKGWVSRRGLFFGDDERTARYDGATHRNCERCEAMVDKSYRFCVSCLTILDHEQWLKLELVEWDGTTPLVIHRDDTYFFSPEEVYDYADGNELKVSELDLVICEPNLAREVDADYWCDDLPGDDGELPGWLEDAVKQLNAVIRAHQNEPLSWSAGKQRVVLPDEAP